MNEPESDDLYIHIYHIQFCKREAKALRTQKYKTNNSRRKTSEDTALTIIYAFYQSNESNDNTKSITSDNKVTCNKREHTKK